MLIILFILVIVSIFGSAISGIRREKQIDAAFQVCVIVFGVAWMAMGAVYLSKENDYRSFCDDHYDTAIEYKSCIDSIK
jgi:anaerobic C4-dicarboxylate transporter